MATLTDSFFQKILSMEGGYQNDPDDTGNYSAGHLVGTKYGVSAIGLSNWYGRPVTESEMRALTESQARDFYAYYFDFYNLFSIGDQELFELIANAYMGAPSAAARILRANFPSGDTGRLTDAYFAGISDVYYRHPYLYDQFRNDWLDYLLGLSNKAKYHKHWKKRMDDHYPVKGFPAPFMPKVRNSFIPEFLLLAAFLILGYVYRRRIFATFNK